MNNLSVGAFPAVIEPTLQVLEARAAYHKDGDAVDLVTAGCWLRLTRLSLAEVAAVVPLPAPLVHIFGDQDRFDDCSLFLGYTGTGVRSHAAYKRNGRWDLIEFPAEACGEAAVLPSVRLTFRDAIAQRAFLHYLRTVRAGTVFNPSLSLVLSKLACEPLSIDVAVP